MKLLAYDFTTEFKKARENILADTLSRQLSEENADEDGINVWILQWVMMFSIVWIDNPSDLIEVIWEIIIGHVLYIVKITNSNHWNYR